MGMSFALPETFSFERVISEEDEAFLEVRNPLIDEYRIFYNIMDSDYNAEKELHNKLEHANPSAVLDPISLIDVKGWCGLQTTYEVEGGNQFFEAFFDVILEDYGSMVFSITVETEHRDIDKIKKSPEFQEILNSIRREQFLV